MNILTAQPEWLPAAAGNLDSIGVALAAHQATTAMPTVGASPAAADDRSVLTAVPFSSHLAMYQAASDQTAGPHGTRLRTLGASAESYATSETAKAIPTVQRRTLR